MLNTYAFNGRAVADPELTYLESGKVVANVRVAIDSFRGSRKAVFIDVKVWDKQAEIMGEVIRKGTLFGGCGPLATEEWEKDGQKRSKVVVYLDQLQLPDKRLQQEQQEQQEYANA